jgi:type IV secretory pathway VirB2 component (pilin)
MYGWLWRKLPGRAAGKAACLVLIVVAVGAALWFGLFPWAQLHVPIDGSTISG